MSKGTRTRAARAAGVHTSRAVRSMQRAFDEALLVEGDELVSSNGAVKRSIGTTVAARSVQVLDPLYELTRVRDLKPLVDQWERAAVAQARRDGVSWSEIATALGVSTQNAHRKYGP